MGIGGSCAAHIHILLYSTCNLIILYFIKKYTCHEIYFFTAIDAAFLQSLSKSSDSSVSMQQSSQLNLMDIKDMMVDWLKFDH